MGSPRADRAASVEVEETYISPEMIQAGREVLWESGLLPVGEEGGSSETVVMGQIYGAMRRACTRG